MAQTKPGEAVPSVAEQAEKSWWVFRHYNAGSARDPHTSYVTGYRRACADMLADLFQFGGLDASIRRLADAIDIVVDTREAVRIVEEETSNGGPR